MISTGLFPWLVAHQTPLRKQYFIKLSVEKRVICLIINILNLFKIAFNFI